MSAALQIDEEAVQAAKRLAARQDLAIRNLRHFARFMWGTADPPSGPKLVWAPHMDIICNALERVSRGEVQELVINIPPRHSKSMLVSVLWQGWMWLHDPTVRVLAISKNENVGKRDNRRLRRLVQSDKFQALLRRKARNDAINAGENPLQAEAEAGWGLAIDQNSKVNFETEHGGSRVCKPILADIIGEGGDGIIVDDPYDAKEAQIGSVEQIAKRMREVVEIYDDVLEHRLDDKFKGWRVTIMQRLHEADLAGVLLARGVESVVLPSEYNPDHPYVCADDPRTERGELLNPRRFPRDYIEKKKQVNRRTYDSQHGQNPNPPDGSVFKKAHFANRYSFDPQREPFDEIGITVDCAFKDASSNSWVVFQAWGRKGANKYILDQVREHMRYVDMRSRLVDFVTKWSLCRFVLVEDKALGTALIDDLKSVVHNIVPYDPGNKSKVERAQVGSQPAFEAGQVWLPQTAPWVNDYIVEHTSFPYGSADDQVDATSQLLLRWGNQRSAVDEYKRRLGWLEQH